MGKNRLESLLGDLQTTLNQLSKEQKPEVDRLDNMAYRTAYEEGYADGYQAAQDDKKTTQR